MNEGGGEKARIREGWKIFLFSIYFCFAIFGGRYSSKISGGRCFMLVCLFSCLRLLSVKFPSVFY